MPQDTSLPPMTRTLIRGVLRRRPGLGGGRTVPRLESRGGPIRVDPPWLARFVTEVDGEPSDTLPILAPQLFAGPLHADLLARPEVPVGMLGMVHVSQDIVVHRPIGVDEPLSVTAWIEGHRVARKGAELDLHTHVRVGDELVWEGVTTALARGPWGDPELPSPPGQPEFEPDNIATVQVPADIGRRWRHVSGDPNPIHLWPLTARLFGFKRAIAHGTWLVARSLVDLGEPTPPASMHFRFRRPVLLPSTVELRSATADGTTRFRLASPDGAVVYVEGTITPTR